MCSSEGQDPVRVSDEDLERVRELRRTAVDALAEANRILATYMGIDADSIDSVTVGVERKTGPEFDDVPPVWTDLCVQSDPFRR